MVKLIVLDSNTGEVHVYSWDVEKCSCEEFIEEQGHQVSNCDWMTVTELKITIH